MEAWTPTSARYARLWHLSECSVTCSLRHARLFVRMSSASCCCCARARARINGTLGGRRTGRAVTVPCLLQPGRTGAEWQATLGGADKGRFKGRLVKCQADGRNWRCVRENSRTMQQGGNVLIEEWNLLRNPNGGC